MVPEAADRHARRFPTLQVNTRMPPYLGLRAEDPGDSFRDGRLFLAAVHSMAPDECPYEPHDSPRDNLTKALKVRVRRGLLFHVPYPRRGTIWSKN